MIQESKRGEGTSQVYITIWYIAKKDDNGQGNNHLQNIREIKEVVVREDLD